MMNSVENIVDLPTEILLTIFTHLPPPDRRVASESCKRFLEIWLCDDFITDRRLVFDKCELASKRDPLKTLLKSQRKYRHLVFGKVKVREVGKIVEKFGETVTTLEFTQSEYNPSPTILHHLSQFPNLKTLKLEPLHLFRELADAVPRNIELCVVSDQRLLYSELKMFIDRLNHLASDSIRIELNGWLLQDIFSRELEYLVEDNIFDKFQSARIFLADFRIESMMPRFENLKYLELDLVWDDVQTNPVLNNLDEQLPALEQLSIKVCHELPCKNWTSFKTLEAWYIPCEEMSRITIFENLQELSLFPRTECFFVHTPFLNKNLKKLTIYFQVSSRLHPCFTCFQTMTKSFPEIESLTFHFNFAVSREHLKELATNTPKLKCLTLDQLGHSVSFDCFPNLTALTINKFYYDDAYMIETWPLMSRLRKFKAHLHWLDELTVNLFKRMPYLEDLEISYSDVHGDCLALFEVMAKSLKRLRNFTSSSWWIDPVDSPKIIDVMATHCNYLRNVTLPCTEGQQEVWRELLQKHSSLRTINATWHFKIRHKQKKINSTI